MLEIPTNVKKEKKKKKKQHIYFLAYKSTNVLIKNMSFLGLIE